MAIHQVPRRVQEVRPLNAMTQSALTALTARFLLRSNVAIDGLSSTHQGSVSKKKPRVAFLLSG